MSTTRRPKWHPPPPPSPKILHLPRRNSRKATKKVAVGKSVVVREADSFRDHRVKQKLETLFDQERSFSRTIPIVLLKGGESERREKVVDFDYGFGEKRRDFEDEKWRFQAEILRAECHFLRMEREIALKKLEKSRAQMERTLRSAVETLISGRKRIYEGKSVGVVLEEEIEGLEEKLEELQRSSRDFDIRKCSNFDKQAAVLQRRLERLGGISEEERMEEIREMAEASLEINTNCKSDDSFASDSKTRFTDVENLGKKMEGLSKGMLEKMEEEYRSMSMISTATSSASSRRIEFPDPSSSSSSSVMRQPHHFEGSTKTVCSGRCKSIVRKLVEQVRAETEQWTQMQEMLCQVRVEMEELQTSRDFWEDRAFHCEDRIRSLHTDAQEWRQKALSSEHMVTELQKQISELRIELERLKTEVTEQQKEPARIRSLPPLPRETQKEKEKRVLICRLKENHQMSSCNVRLVATTKRSPLQDIGNSSPLNLQTSRS